jgi:hypothetical protein
VDSLEIAVINVNELVPNLLAPILVVTWGGMLSAFLMRPTLGRDSVTEFSTGPRE